MIPDEFLRRWDPITFFFPRDTGPAGGGDVLDPGPSAEIEPAHPGAWTWLDARTLRFRPADPWPPLSRFTVRAGGTVTDLATLLATPRSTLPSDSDLSLGDPLIGWGVQCHECVELPVGKVQKIRHAAQV